MNRIVVGAGVAVMVLALVSSALAEAGKWQVVGKEGEWANTRLMVAFDGVLWGVETDGALFRISQTGEREMISKPTGFTELRLLAAMKDKLYGVDAEGNLFAADKSGKWQMIGQKDGRLKAHVQLVPVQETLYAIQKNGTIFRLNAEGALEKVGEEGTLEDCQIVTVLNGNLFLLVPGGQFLKADLKAGKWLKLGEQEQPGKPEAEEQGKREEPPKREDPPKREEPPKRDEPPGEQKGQRDLPEQKAAGFREPRIMLGLEGALWVIEKHGTLHRVDPATGKATQVGEPGRFADIRLLVGLGGELYTVDKGNLFKTAIK